MAFCDPFGECINLDGRLVINRTLTGPALSDVTADLAMELAGASVPGVRLLPYVKARFVQTWTAGDSCIGPARSVVGLAPGEEMVFEQRTMRQFDFSSVITRNQEFSSTFGSESRTENEDIETSVEATSTSTTDTDTVDLGPLGTWGSGGDADVDTVEEVIERTVRTLNETLVSVSSTQVNGLTTEITSSSSITTETSLSRRIVNPLMDRTLELRFHPVFRTFMVTTTFDSWNFGMLLRPADIRFDRDFVVRNPRFISKVVPALAAGGSFPPVDPVPLTGTTYARYVQPDPMNSVVAELSSSPRRHTRRFLLYTRNAEGLSPFRRFAEEALAADKKLAATQNLPVQGGFAIDKVQVRGRDIEVPARSSELFVRAVKLPQWQQALLSDLLSDEVLQRFRLKFTFTQTVMMFMGTHLEVVPGQCSLPVATPLEPRRGGEG